MSRALSVVLVLFVIGCASEDANHLAQLRDSIRGHEDEPAEKVFKNVRVLPETVPGVTAGRLLQIMELAYSRGLGVSCSHCHTPGQWADDAKQPKQIARGMSRMTTRIVHELLPAIEEIRDRKPAISCATCHRGELKPLIRMN